MVVGRLILSLGLLALAGACTPSPAPDATPDAEATVAAGVEATVQVQATPPADPTPTPTATPAATPSPAPTRAPTPAPATTPPPSEPASLLERINAAMGSLDSFHIEGVLVVKATREADAALVSMQFEGAFETGGDSQVLGDSQTSQDPSSPPQALMSVERWTHWRAPNKAPGRERQPVGNCPIPTREPAHRPPFFYVLDGAPP